MMQLLKACLLVLTLAIATVYSLSAQQSEHYSKVKVDLTHHHISEVAILGLEADHGIYKKGKHLINDFSERELSLLEQAGIPYQVLVEDVQAMYRDQNKHGHDHSHDHSSHSRSTGVCDEAGGLQYNYTTPANYVYGSMGGYLTYDEAITELDRMVDLYPELISPRAPIGDIKTHNGNDIYWMKLSDNVATDEEEPEVLYTSLHHAREPNSLSQMIFYLWYLLENYETDLEVQYLVDETEMYFIPIVNPDGYQYNEQTNPDGGGLWRKNRKAVGLDTFGVDLNRNYGYEWGYDDVGSSPEPTSAVYRGEAGFSEPETQAVRDFCNEHKFKIAMNYHTFGNLLIYPWGYSDSETVDFATFRGIGTVLTAENNYRAGTGSETVGYVVNGNSDDWMYGDTEEKPAIFALTPEVGPGNYGFWPPQDAIDQLNKSALLQNITTAHLLLHYVTASEVEPQTYISAAEQSLDLVLKRYGLEDGQATLTVTAVGDNVELLDAQAYTVELSRLEIAEYTYKYVITDAASSGDKVRLAVSIDNGKYVLTDTIVKVFVEGDYQPIFVDRGDSISSWLASGDWGETSATFVSGPTCYTDSPDGDYERNTISVLALDQTIDLEGAESAFLRFYAKWDIEDEYDFVQAQVSVDGGANYVSLCGLYTNPGSSFQDQGEPLYDDVQEEWVAEQIDLTEYVGQQIFLRFRFESDGGVEADGFYVDDIIIETASATGTATDRLTGHITSLVTYPNPTTEQLSVDFYVDEYFANSSIALVNSLGQQVATTGGQAFYPGRQEIRLSTADLPSGVYTMRVSLSSRVAYVQKVIKVD